MPSETQTSSDGETRYDRAVSTTPPDTPRLEFHRWAASEVAVAASLWCDPQVMRFLGGPYTDEEVASRLARELANEDALGIQYWPLYMRGSGEFAGCCGLKPYEPEPHSYELGFHFRPSFWGRGYAFEAASNAIAYAFGDLGAHALFAGHHPANAASAALLAKLGFARRGTHFFARTGLQHPWYRLLADSGPRQRRTQSPLRLRRAGSGTILSMPLLGIQGLRTFISVRASRVGRTV